MAADPIDIALYTTDGVVVTSPSDAGVSAAIRAADPNARDPGDSPFITFFDLASDAQAMLDEKFAFVSSSRPVHEGIEVADTLSLGRDIPITPTVPRYRVVDETRAIDVVVPVRAYSRNMDSDRFSVEVLG